MVKLVEDVFCTYPKETKKKALSALLNEEEMALSNYLKDKERSPTVFEFGEEQDYFLIHNGWKDDRKTWKVDVGTKDYEKGEVFYKAYHPKVQNKFFVEYHCLTRKKYAKLYKFFYYSTFIKPVEDLVREFGFRNGRISAKALQQLYKTKHILRQAKQDGQDNILWFIYKYGETPAQLKERFGKGVWKTICKNSKYRNKLLSSALTAEVPYLSEKLGVKEIVSLPTTFLRNRHKVDMTEKQLYWAWLNTNGKELPLKTVFKSKGKNDIWYRRDVLYKARDLFSDTNRMYYQLFREKGDHLFDLSYRRIKELHEEYYKEITARKVKNPDDVYPVFEAGRRNILYTVKHPTNPEWEAVLLIKPRELIEEGRSQHHCVASYTECVASGEYLVYSIRKNGERYSTLGLSNFLNSCSNGRWKINQHYKAMNLKVDDQNATDLEEIIKDWYDYLS